MGHRGDSGRSTGLKSGDYNEDAIQQSSTQVPVWGRFLGKKHHHRWEKSETPQLAKAYRIFGIFGRQPAKIPFVIFAMHSPSDVPCIREVSTIKVRAPSDTYLIRR